MARLLVLPAAVCFGTTGTAQALGPDAAPVTVGAARIAVGGLLLAWPSPRRPRRGRRPGRAGSSARSPWRSRSTSSRSSRPSTDTGVAVGTVVALGSAPAIAGTTGRLIDGQPLTGRWAAATALACAGVLLLVSAAATRSVDALGIMLALVAGSGYATYTVLAKRMLAAATRPSA